MSVHPFGAEAWLTEGRLWTGAWILGTWAIAVVLLYLSDRTFNRIDDRLTRFNVPERRLSKLDTLADALILVLAILVTLYLLGVGQALWGAIALTSISGVVVGLAAQRFGENLIAGAVLLFERPFQPGDTIRVGDHEGTVRAVTLHSTTMQTLDGLTLTMPNQRVIDSAITNLSACRQRRVTVDVDVDVGTEQLDAARYSIRQAVEGDEHLVEDRETVVFAAESLDEGIRFTARYWVEADSYGSHCKPTALRRVLDRLHEEGFETSMPTQRVYTSPARET